MAMEGTHIRFALDLKEKLNVTDECSYIIGAVYPDSRYFTKIDRALTHPKGYRSDPRFQKSDFNKGWFTHLLCDDIQYNVLHEVFPKLGENIPGQDSREWIQRTSLKILQDMEDVQSFEIESMLSCLDSVSNPNTEDESILRKYHELLQDIYKNPQNIKLDSYLIFMHAIGLDKNLGNRLMEQTRSYQSDEDSMPKIKNLYEEVIKQADMVI